MIGVISRVMTKCPTSGLTVPTVYRMRAAAVEGLRGEFGFRCERCGEIHTWRREDAWLEEGVKTARTA
jgi:hypothetical protein